MRRHLDLARAVLRNRGCGLTRACALRAALLAREADRLLAIARAPAPFPDHATGGSDDANDAPHAARASRLPGRTPAGGQTAARAGRDQAQVGMGPAPAAAAGGRLPAVTE